MDTLIENKVKLFYIEDGELVEGIIIKNTFEDIPPDGNEFRPDDNLFHTSNGEVRDYRVGMFLSVDVGDVIVKRKIDRREIIEVWYQGQGLTDFNLIKVSYVFLSV